VRISICFKDDVAIMGLSGKFLAGSDGPFLRQKVKDLAEAGTRKLVIDFSAVPYIDSTGIGFLVGSRLTCHNAGVAMVISGMNQHVRHILDGVRLTAFFTLVENEAAALERVNVEASKPAAERTTQLKTKKHAAESAET
jgi:anti-anti-sigma factor